MLRGGPLFQVLCDKLFRIHKAVDLMQCHATVLEFVLKTKIRHIEMPEFPKARPAHGASGCSRVGVHRGPHSDSEVGQQRYEAKCLGCALREGE